MVRSAFVLLAIAGSSTARAEPAEKISIDRLVRVAVEKSSTLAFVRSTQRSADLAVTAAGAGAEWQVKTTVGVDHTRDTTNLNGGLEIAKQVATGGAVSLAVESVEQLPHTRASEPVLTSASKLTLSIRQPLLRGRGDGAHVDQHKARVAADATTLQSRDDSGALIRTLVEAYWELAFAHANLGVREQSLKLAKSQLDLTKKMYERGTVPDNAIKSARYGVALREEAWLRANDAVQSASLQLRKLAGLEIAIDLGDLVPVDALFVARPVDDIESVVRTALAENPRIAAAKLGIVIAGVELDRRRNRALPALDIGLGASAFGTGTDRIAAFENVGDGYQVTGTLSLTWDIGGAANAAAETARLDKAVAKMTARDVERDVVADVIDVVRRIGAAKQRAVVAERAIELATANLDTEIALFRADKSSNVLVFERQTELDEARLLASRAAADSLIASATLDYLTGTLLDRYGIEVIPTTQGARRHVQRP